MINIPANFSSKSEMKCECGLKEDMSHIYECGLYNMVIPEIPFVGDQFDPLLYSKG